MMDLSSSLLGSVVMGGFAGVFSGHTFPQRYAKFDMHFTVQLKAQSHKVAALRQTWSCQLPDTYSTAKFQICSGPVATDL